MAPRPVEADETAPLHVILSSVRTMPRPILSRLVAKMIEQLDELDGDADLEPDDDDTAIDDGACDQDTDTEPGSWAEDQSQYGTLHSYADDEREDDAPEARRPHCRRIRATRCERHARYGNSPHRLSATAAREVMGLYPDPN